MKHFIINLIRYLVKKQFPIIVNGREIFVSKDEELTRQYLIELADLGRHAVTPDSIDESKLQVTYNYDLCIPADYMMNDNDTLKAKEGMIFWVTGTTPV